MEMRKTEVLVFGLAPEFLRHAALREDSYYSGSFGKLARRVQLRSLQCSMKRNRWEHGTLLFFIWASISVNGVGTLAWPLRSRLYACRLQRQFSVLRGCAFIASVRIVRGAQGVTEAAGVGCDAGLREVEVRTLDEMRDLMATGLKSRTQAATRANQNSSRSHAIFTMMFSQAKVATDTGVAIENKASRRPPQFVTRSVTPSSLILRHTLNLSY